MTLAGTDEPVLFCATVLAGSLAGMELASWAVVHPAMWRLEHIEQVHAEKALYRRFGMVQAGAATGCFAAMLGVTFAGNMTINVAVLRWQEPGDPGRWRRLRRRWDRIHTVRVLLDTAGFGLLVAACLE